MLQVSRSLGISYETPDGLPFLRPYLWGGYTVTRNTAHAD